MRELRQNLSVCLARVIAGDRLEITDRGNPVAMLIPIRPGATLVERLTSESSAADCVRAAPRLRSLDAIHLASALSIGDYPEAFVTYDERLADAARGVGLNVMTPE